MSLPIIPPKSEWKDMTLMQLYEVKSNLMDVLYGMRSIKASFSGQYSKFIAELDALILRKQQDQEKDQY